MFTVNKLKISGFKSFAHPTELLIEDGVTGIVGPNGCGKSNVFEAIIGAIFLDSSYENCRNLVKECYKSSFEELIGYSRHRPQRGHLTLICWRRLWPWVPVG